MAAETRVDTIIRGGQVVTSSQVLDAAVAIQGEKIVAVAPEHLLPPADRVIDAEGKFVLPGLIDAHVHLDGHDDYALGALAAAYAGMTTLIPFGNYTLDGDETLPQAGHRIREEINASAVVDFGFHFILQNRPSILRSLPEAMDMGFKSFKMFMTYKKRPGRMCDDDYICEAMEMVARGGGVLQLHCESGNIIEYLENKLIADGHTHPEFFPVACPDGPRKRPSTAPSPWPGPPAAPPMSSTSAPTWGWSASSRRRRWASPSGPRPARSTLLLSDAEMARVGPLAKIGPPLRPEDGPDRDALWAGLQRGHISIVASDHSPHPQELKKPGWDNIFVTPDGASVPFGSPGIETLAPLMYSEGVVKRGMPITWLARIMAENPARVFGLYPRKGVIQPGADADLLILDPGVDRVITAGDHMSNADYTCSRAGKSPAAVHDPPPRQVLLNDGKLEQRPGYGQFMECEGQ